MGAAAVCAGGGTADVAVSRGCVRQHVGPCAQRAQQSHRGLGMRWRAGAAALLIRVYRNVAHAHARTAQWCGGADMRQCSQMCGFPGWSLLLQIESVQSQQSLVKMAAPRDALRARLRFCGRRFGVPAKAARASRRANRRRRRHRARRLPGAAACGPGLGKSVQWCGRRRRPPRAGARAVTAPRRPAARRAPPRQARPSRPRRRRPRSARRRRS